MQNTSSWSITAVGQEEKKKKFLKNCQIFLLLILIGHSQQIL